jgi:hypothetical protein
VGQGEYPTHDHATAQVVWALIAESSNDALENFTPSPTVCHLSTSSQSIGDQSYPDEFHHATGGGTDAQKAIDEMEKALFPQPDDDIIAYIRSIIVSSMDLDDDVPLDDIIPFVQSIMALDLNPICPKFWHHAMKDPAHRAAGSKQCSNILTAVMQSALLVHQGFHLRTSPSYQQ